MIRLVDLKKSYAAVNALNGVSAQVKPGSITGIVGPNGCGKTTLIKCILGLVVPDQGQIFVDGVEVHSRGWRHRENLGYMPQNPEFPGNLRVNELLEMMADIRGVAPQSRSELIDRFEVQPFLDRPFGTLSGGTKQKVAVVSALMFNPKIIILDEPTVGLDPVSARRFKDLIKARAASGAAVLLVSHILSEMDQLVDNMVFMLEGRVEFSGAASDLRKLSEEGLSIESAVIQFLERREQALPSSRKPLSGEVRS